MDKCTLMSGICGRSLRRLQMELLVAVCAWASSSVCRSTSPDSRMGSLLCNRGDTYYDLTPLEARLSQNASVIYPNDTATFEYATSRWSSYETPTISVVVVPGTENDVAETVGRAELYTTWPRHMAYFIIGEVRGCEEHVIPCSQWRSWSNHHGWEDEERD